ncbi:hypothetical protein BD311DRAFT_157555 [Dichomitus squalens]|uniref:Uncharacterized protein n=1 Tax=Dichomitus squalens TaxID=114155 RepID=A0A4Q9M5F8_9APHY|nr:hypothetical protein BD311DRAFT_157555 [Dichomitus squalens]
MIPGASRTILGTVWDPPYPQFSCYQHPSSTYNTYIFVLAVREAPVTIFLSVTSPSSTLVTVDVIMHKINQPHIDNMPLALHAAKHALDRANSGRDSKRPKGDEQPQGSSIQAAANLVQDDGVNLLISGVESLVDNLPPFVKALDAVSKMHPFVAIAVAPFKIAMELEIRRQNNDKKVNLLFLEMQNMMSALLQLQHVPPNHTAPDDGLMVEDHLRELMTRIAGDIEECANACNAYSNSPVLLKAFKGYKWEEKFKEHIKTFASRKTEIIQALSMHSAIGIDHANDKLDRLMERTELLLQYFERCAPRSQRVLSSMIGQVGGPDAALRDPATLRSLLDSERSLEYKDGYIPPRPHISHTFTGSSSVLDSRHSSRIAAWPPLGIPHSRMPGRTNSSRVRSMGTNSQYSRLGSRTDAGSQYRDLQRGNLTPGSKAPSSAWPDGSGEIDYQKEMSVLRQEVTRAPSVEITANRKTFQRRFDIRIKGLRDEMARLSAHQGEWIVGTVLQGPHERIMNPDLRDIWKDMRWRAIVKPRHLVLAIHDFYLQKLDDQQRARDVKVEGTGKQCQEISEADAWTLQCIDLMHFQPIIEAQ